MAKYALVTDSSCDLSQEYRESKGIEYVKMLINWRDDKGEHENICDIDWKVLSIKEFYGLIRSGIVIKTAMVTMDDYLNTFESHLKKGEDVIYLACSSGLSNSLNIARSVIQNELKEKYPDRKVVVVDTLRAGMAQGMIVMLAQELKEKGKSLEEVVEIVEKEKLHYKEVGIPETLSYLRRAGRVKAAAATFGNIIGLKPILMFNDEGLNEAKEKAIGKKKAFVKMAEILKEDIVDPKNQDIYMMHADCNKEDIKAFSDAINAQVKVKSIIVRPIGPVIGASSGPGTIIVNYKGK